MMQIKEWIIPLFICFLVSPVLAGQVCNSTIPQFSNSIYEDQGDGTITDKSTGLSWMVCSLGQTWKNNTCLNNPQGLSYEDAKLAVQKVNEDPKYFYSDWKLPSLKEMAFITDMRCKNPRINLSVFPNTPSNLFWTSSTKLVEGPELQAYAMHFGEGGLVLSNLNQKYYVRLVRRADL
jgi:hypothetical protein